MKYVVVTFGWGMDSPEKLAEVYKGKRVPLLFDSKEEAEKAAAQAKRDHAEAQHNWNLGTSVEVAEQSTIEYVSGYKAYLDSPQTAK